MKRKIIIPLIFYRHQLKVPVITLFQVWSAEPDKKT